MKLTTKALAVILTFSAADNINQVRSELLRGNPSNDVNIIEHLFNIDNDVIKHHRSLVPSQLLVSENYDTAQVIGQRVEGADEVVPSVPTVDYSVTVVDSSNNPAGTGNGARLVDKVTNKGCRLSYDLVGSAAEQLSTAQIHFSFSQMGASSSSGDYFKISVGEFGVAQTGSSRRFFDSRLYEDGTMDFRSGTGPDSTNNALIVPGSNTLSIFVNDFDARSIDYANPDGSGTSVLPANSVAYWLNGNKISFGGQGYTALEDRITAKGTIFTSQNNIGRFSITSLTSDYGLDIVIDNLEISSIVNQLVSEGFETGQTVGQRVEGADEVVPSAPTTEYFVTVVDSINNPAGTGNGARLVDNVTNKGCRLSYDLVGSAAEQLSTAQIHFSFSLLSTASGSGDYFKISVGEYGVAQSSNSKRFLDNRLYEDGTMDFRSGTGPDSTNNALIVPGSNTLSIFVNDFDARSIDYANPDGSGNSVLPANSVAYWLNGSKISFGGQGYTAMGDRTTTGGGTIFSSENNIGRFSITSLTSDYGLDVVIDNLEISSIVTASEA